MNVSFAEAYGIVFQTHGLVNLFRHFQLKGLKTAENFIQSEI